MSLLVHAYLVPLLSGIITLILGVVILANSKKDKDTRIFILFIFLISLWLLGSALMLSQCTNEQRVILIDRIIYFFVAAIPATVFHFAYVHTKLPRRFFSFVLLGYILMAAFWVVVWTPDFLRGINHFGNACHSAAGRMHDVFLVYFVSYSILALLVIFRHLSRCTADKKRRQQHKFIFVALVAQAVVGTSAFLPAYNINSFSFSYLSGIITSFILMYAIFRHDLLKLKNVSMKVFIIFVIVALFFQAMLTEGDAKIINAMIFILVALLGVLMIRNMQEEIENREKGERLARYLANANARLRKLDKQKTEFVSIASHQLRGPITAISGYAALIEDGSYGKVPPYLKEPVSRIFQSGRRLSLIVNDFLNVTRIEQGRMSYDKKPCDITEMIKKVVQEMRVLAEKKGLSITLENKLKHPAHVLADESKLSQVFFNLIDNAIKYTEKGSIHIKIVLDHAESHVLISISDTGIGVDPTELGDLFKKFNRASNANNLSVSGAGLGLYIAREITKAHDGWVNAMSAGLNKGTTFTVELPLYVNQK